MTSPITEVIIKEIFKDKTGKALPVGTKRQRQDGVYEKISDGTWVKIKPDKPTEADPKGDTETVEEQSEVTTWLTREETNKLAPREDIKEALLPSGKERKGEDNEIFNLNFEARTWTVGSYGNVRFAEQALDAGVDPEKLDPKLVNRVKTLRALIENGPKFKGAVSRGIDVEQGFSDAVVGDEFSLKAMASFSQGKSAAGRFNDRNIILTILNSDNGVDISKISTWPEEKEILIPKTKYKIKKIEDTGMLSADQTPQKRIILEAA